MLVYIIVNLIRKCISDMEVSSKKYFVQSIGNARFILPKEK